jgi:hypothetical protein
MLPITTGVITGRCFTWRCAFGCAAMCTAVFVRVKVAGVLTPLTLAVAVKVPATLLAVNVGAVASP